MVRRMGTLGVMIVVGMIAAFALLPVAGAAPRGETKPVSAKDFLYEPKTISVNAGDTVVWKNDGQVIHSVTADDGSFDGDIQAGQEFSQTFATAGTIAYYCKYHGSKGGTGMAGTVTVAAAAQPTAAPAAQPTAMPAGEAPSGSVEASDQAATDNSITIAKVTAGQDGWIVAHLDEGGKPGKVLGQTAVKKGDNSNVVIKLSESVPAGGKLWPMLHIDAGTVGTYEFPGPDAPVIVNGDIVMKQISVTGGGGAPAPLPADAVDAADQTLKENSITIARVSASQDGWIVAHLDEGGKPGKVLGQTAVKKGDNSNVVIKLSESVPAGGKLWPMLHIDAGTIGTYEFPGPDAPVIVNGNIIMKQISVTAAGTPGQLPRTGGEEQSIGLALAALVLLLGGMLLTQYTRRRA